MRSCEVENSEERLAFAAIAPVCLTAAFVPGTCWRIKLVIGLGIIRAVITFSPDIFAETFYISRWYALAAHVVGPVSGRIHAGNDPRSRRGTNSGMRIHICIAYPPGSEFVDIGRYGVAVAVAAEIGADIFCADPEDIRPLPACRLGGVQGDLGQCHCRR